MIQEYSILLKSLQRAKKQSWNESEIEPVIEKSEAVVCKWIEENREKLTASDAKYLIKIHDRIESCSAENIAKIIREILNVSGGSDESLKKLYMQHVVETYPKNQQILQSFLKQRPQVSIKEFEKFAEFIRSLPNDRVAEKLIYYSNWSDIIDFLGEFEASEHGMLIDFLPRHLPKVERVNYLKQLDVKQRKNLVSLIKLNCQEHNMLDILKLCEIFPVEKSKELVEFVSPYLSEHDWNVKEIIQVVKRFSIEERFDILHEIFLIPSSIQGFLLKIFDYSLEERKSLLEQYQKVAQADDDLYLDWNIFNICCLFKDQMINESIVQVVRNISNIGRVSNLTQDYHFRNSIIKLIARLPSELQSNIPTIKNIVSLMEVDRRFPNDIKDFILAINPTELPDILPRVLAFKTIRDDSSKATLLIDMLGRISPEKRDQFNELLIEIDGEKIEDIYHEPIYLLGGVASEQILQVAQFYVANKGNPSVLNRFYNLRNDGHFYSGRYGNLKRMRAIDATIPLIDVVSDTKKKLELMEIAFKFPPKNMIAALRL